VRENDYIREYMNKILIKGSLHRHKNISLSLFVIFIFLNFTLSSLN